MLYARVLKERKYLNKEVVWISCILFWSPILLDLIRFKNWSVLS